MIQGAAAAGLRAIELGAGDEDYKLRFANGAIPVAAGLVGGWASLPLLWRRMRHGVEAVARRLPVGRAAEWPARLFFRIEWELNHR